MKKILIVNPFGIGDVIFSMHLVEAVREAFPDAVIGFVCNERTEDLVRMNRAIDQTFVFNRDFYRCLWKRSPVLFFNTLKGFLSEIRARRFETLVDLSLGREYSFFSMLIGIPKRIGFDFKGRGIFLTQKKRIKGYEGERVADIQLGLLDFLGIHSENISKKISLVATDSARQDAERILRAGDFYSGDNVVAVAPGGGRSWGANAIFKQWDAERFAESVNRLGQKSPLKVLVLGDKTEQDLLHRTSGMIREKVLVVAGEPLGVVSVLLLRSSLLLCNDGGLLHLANALGVKTVSIFGPVDEKVYGPYNRNVAFQVVTQAVPCRPCYQRFVFPPCPYQRRCLNDLTVEKVVEAAARIAYT